MSNNPIDPYRSAFDLLVHAARTGELGLLHAKVKATGEDVGLVVGVRLDGKGVGIYPVARMLGPGEAEALYELPDDAQNSEAKA